MSRLPLVDVGPLVADDGSVVGQPGTGAHAAALELDGGRYSSPYGFVRALRSRQVKAPASQQEGAVRLLTLHGAKGLEARAVLLGGRSRRARRTASRHGWPSSPRMRAARRRCGRCWPTRWRRARVKKPTPCTWR